MALDAGFMPFLLSALFTKARGPAALFQLKFPCSIFEQYFVISTGPLGIYEPEHDLVINLLSGLISKQYH